jgi:DNA-binding CsgD family transcriptional regulator
LGAAARLTVCLKYFRIFCIINFLAAVILNPVIEYLFVGNEEKNSLIALGLMVVIFCVLFLCYPAVNKIIFESGWFEGMSVRKPEPEGYHIEDLGLTPREKEIFRHMLTEKSVKQIMIELEISKGTFNFHSANLYRKLGIQSRTELFAKYGRP